MNTLDYINIFVLVLGVILCGMSFILWVIVSIFYSIKRRVFIAHPVIHSIKIGVSLILKRCFYLFLGGIIPGIAAMILSEYRNENTNLYLFICFCAFVFMWWKMIDSLLLFKRIKVLLKDKNPIM